MDRDFAPSYRFSKRCAVSEIYRQLGTRHHRAFPVNLARRSYFRVARSSSYTREFDRKPLIDRQIGTCAASLNLSTLAGWSEITRGDASAGNDGFLAVQDVLDVIPRLLQ